MMLRQRAFSVAAPLTWNRLPTTLKLMRCTHTFKDQLKLFCTTLHTISSSKHRSSFFLSCIIGPFVGGALKVHVVIVIEAPFQPDERLSSREFGTRSQKVCWKKI
jgi:hypothetical protein